MKMANIDYTECPKCDGRLQVRLNSSFDEGEIECEKCKFFSTITRKGWTIDETEEPFNYP